MTNWTVHADGHSWKLELVPEGLVFSNADRRDAPRWSDIARLEFSSRAGMTMVLTGGATRSVGFTGPIERLNFRMALEEADAPVVWDRLATPTDPVRNPAGTATQGRPPASVSGTELVIGLFSGVKGLVAGAGLTILLFGFVYTHSNSFKEQCLAHKLDGESIGFVKNIVCDADFTIKN